MDQSVEKGDSSVPDQFVEKGEVPIQCESDPYGLNGIIIYDKETYPMPDQSVEKDHSSVPMEWESEPDGTIVYDEETYPMPDQSVEEDHSSVPIQCESDPYGLNGIIIYDKETYPMPARYRHNRAQLAFDDNSPVPQHGGTPAENYLSANEPLNRQERCNQRPKGDVTSTVPLSWWMNNQLKAGLTIMLLGIIIYVILGNMV